MKEMTNKINMLDTNTKTIIEDTERRYNTLRNSEIRLYTKSFNGSLSLKDKQCLSLYLSVINNDNFYSRLLNSLGYNKFSSFPITDTNVQHYENEISSLVNLFSIGNSLEMIVLYLLDYPIIKHLNLKEGYSIWKIKLAIYDYLSKEIVATNTNNKENKQKVLTK